MNTSTSHHHKGLPAPVERFNSTLLGLARASAGGSPGDWKDALPFLLFATRATANRVTRRSPAELLYGRPLTPPLPTLHNPHDTARQQSDALLLPYCRAQVRRMRIAWEAARIALQEEQVREKARFDSTHPRPARSLAVGDSVLVHEPDLRRGTTKLTRGLAWTGPYRIEELREHNNVLLRDLRSRRLHPVVHLDRLRRFREHRQLAPDEYVLERMQDVRRVSVARARGRSRLEFLVKWKGYTQRESTWEPMETLRDTVPEEVDDFLQEQQHHPAVRAWKNSRSKSPTGRNATGRSSEGPSTPSSAPSPLGAMPSPRALPKDGKPVAAAFMRGLWHYHTVAERSDGRITQRWLPQHAFEKRELDSDHFEQLRHNHLSSLPSEDAAMIALILTSSDGFG